MGYILRLNSDNSRVDRIDAQSMEEARLYFIRRKQLDEKVFDKLYKIEKERCRRTASIFP